MRKEQENRYVHTVDIWACDMVKYRYRKKCRLFWKKWRPEMTGMKQCERRESVGGTKDENDVQRIRRAVENEKNGGAVKNNKKEIRI